MNENEYIARIARQQIEAGSPLVLVSIMSLQGSTPRHNGAKMVVGADGKSYGTIGGSLIEATAITESQKVFTAAQSRTIEFELTGKDASSPGMICGGKAELLLDYLPPTEANKEFARGWHEGTLSGNDFYFLTHLRNTRYAIDVLGHAILHPDGDIHGNTSLTASDIESLKPELHNISATMVFSVKDTRVLVDRICKLKTMYCFGAGHVAVPTAHIAALAGFRVVVLDDRPEYANVERFPEAGEIHVIDNFNHAMDGLEIDADSFIVILTRGHQYDREVLEQALKTSAGYIGMISSRRKREAIYEALMADGVKKEDLEKVHSPIGLDIGGETPEEIAVSIVAELISERSKQKS
jgi:xanthine dehydrogenase accessory factor